MAASRKLGKVTKNVTGYDMMKLYIGSLGTLAVIAEATLKLRPVPLNQELVWATFTGQEAGKNRSTIARRRIAAERGGVGQSTCHGMVTPETRRPGRA